MPVLTVPMDAMMGHLLKHFIAWYPTAFRVLKMFDHYIHCLMNQRMRIKSSGFNLLVTVSLNHTNCLISFFWLKQISVWKSESNCNVSTQHSLLIFPCKSKFQMTGWGKVREKENRYVQFIKSLSEWTSTAFLQQYLSCCFTKSLFTCFNIKKKSKQQKIHTLQEN